MSNGRRRPKLSRANLRPTDSGAIKEGRLAKQRTRATLLALVAVSVVATAAIVHGSGAPFTYRIGQRPDRELRVNVKEFKLRNQTKTSNERQAAADQVPPAMINDPGSDPRAGRAARRPDHCRCQIGSIRRPARKRQVGLEAEARELSRSQGGHRHSRAARQAARSDRRRVPTAAPRRRARARHLAAQRRIEPAAVDPQGGRAPCRGAAGAARSRRARADRQTRRARLSRVLLGLHLAARSARSSSA